MDISQFAATTSLIDVLRNTIHLFPCTLKLAVILIIRTFAP
jgi:hypothetical protein